MPSKNIIIYTLLCPTTKEVRYVGKCHDRKARMRQHLFEARSGNKTHKCDWMRSLLTKGLRPIMVDDLVLPPDADWKAAEHARVSFYRKQGCNLTNATDGGDSGGILTEEGRRILAERASEKFGTPEGRKRQSELMKDLCSDPEWRKQRDEAAKATRATPEYKARMSARAKAKWADPAYRQKMARARAEVVARPEYREKLSRATTRNMQRPEVRAHLAEATRRSWMDQDLRERKIASIKAAMRDGKDAK